MVLDLAHHEAGCCPFLEQRVQIIGERLRWTITNPIDGDSRANAELVLDIFYDLADRADTSTEGIFEHLAARGVNAIRPPGTTLG